MKLWEALKTLEENPEKEFKCGIMRLVRESDVYRFINVNTHERAFYMGAHNDWKEIKQPVTWQEAIKAWMNGKTICVTQKDIEKRFYEGKDYLLRDQHGDSVSEDEIAEGTWYIED